ncbi:MAG: (2Fe-2S)-binding protein [Lachnospiraceae bacterium]|nr:(2Fe-2S)-binding protein [Lachnospiraceae bacterium]
MKQITIEVTVNGTKGKLTIDPNKRLLDMLREDLGLTSVKEGCSEGECGACTVIFNGDPVTTCCMLAGQADGAEIITVEGLAIGGKIDPVQQAFMEVGAVQCGYCIPGMLLTAKALLMKNPDPTDAEIRVAMSGNLCRCTGYAKIHDGVKLAAKMMKEQQKEAVNE